MTNPSATKLLLSTAALLAASGTFVSPAKAQSDPPLAFEVASVKQHPIPNGFLRRAQSSNLKCPPWQCGISGNRFTEEVASLMDLIMDAYNVKRFQISGLPPWGNSGRDVYDITATVEGGRTPTIDQARRMLQTLLADRFQLKLHRETRELPVYALVVAKNGPKLNRVPLEEGKPPAQCPTRSVRPEAAGGGGDSKGGGGGRDGGGGGNNKTFRFAGGGPSGEELIAMRSWERTQETLAMFADRPVIDKTGLAGIYCTANGEDPLMAVLSQIGPREVEEGSAIFTLVQEKWGLKLEPQKAPVEVLVIDRVARPSEN